MVAEMDMRMVWEKVVDQVKTKVIHPTLWRTLEIATPITIENNEFIVGFSPANFYLSGHMTSSDHKNVIESALREISGAPFNLRVIEGETIQDWRQVQVKEERARELRDAAYRKREAEAAVTKSWDGLMEQVGRRYASLPLRQLPQFRARYIEEMMEIISDTMDVLMPAGAPMDELAERSLARVLDKMSTVTEVPAALIALELMRFRAGKE